MEPLSITSSIAGILGGVATIASKINTLKQRYSQSELNITLTSSMLFSVKRALESIQEMRDGSRDTSKASQQLDKDLGVPLESCAVLIAMVERSLEGIDLENPSRAEKWRFVRLNETFVQTERSLDAQVRALTLLLTIYQCGTLAEQTARLRSRDTRLVLDRVRRDTASTIQFLEDREGSDAASILSSEPSVKFMFDDDLLQHPMYQRTYPHLWRRNNVRNRDSDASPRQSVAISPAMPPPPVPRKDVPSDQIQSPTATESDTVRAGQAPPPPPKSAPLQRTNTALLSPPSTAGLLSPNSAEVKRPRKKRSRSRSTGPDPLLGALPSIPFLGIPFQGEQVDNSSESEASEESEAEEVAADTAPTTSTAPKSEEPAEATIDQTSDITMDQAEANQDIPSTDGSTATPAEEAEDQEPRKLPSRAVKLQSKYRSRLSETPVKSDAESDLYGVSDQEYEPPSKSKSETDSKSPPGSPEEVAQDIPTINVPQNETERPTTAVKIGSDSIEPEEDTANAHYAEENTQTDIDRIVSHIRHHRARSATDIGSTVSVRSSSRGRSISDTTGKDQMKLDVDLQSRSPSRGESVSTRSDQPSQDALDSTFEAFSPKLDLPLLDDAGSFVINFDQRSSEGRASTTGASPAVAPVEEGENVPVMYDLPPASTPAGSQDEDEAEESIVEEDSSPRKSSMQAAAPVRAPPVPPTTDTLPSQQAPPPLHAPPPPPQTEESVPTSATLSRPPILPPMQGSPTATTERRSSVAKLSAPPVPPRPVSRPVSQPPPVLQRPSPQASPSLSQSPLQPSPASTPGLPTQAVTALPIKKLPPPVPPPRLARSAATRRVSNASQATTATEQTETATVESPRRPPPPVPQQVAPSSPSSTPSSHASPQIPPKLHVEVQEEVARTPSVHAQTPPPTTAIAQPTSPPSTVNSPGDYLQQTVSSDAASSVGSTMTGSRNSGSFWDAHSVASTHHTTVNSGLHPTITNEGLPLDPSDDTIEQAAQRRLMMRLGSYDQKGGRGKSKLLPKASTSRLSNIFGSSEKKLAKLKSMHEAARAGQIGILEEILREHRKSVNGLEKITGSEAAKTLLMRAAEGDHVECMKLLVRFGADVAVADSHGQVALHYAIQNVAISATLWLAQYRPSVPTLGINHVEIGDENGFRPLHVAAAKGNGTMMDILIQHGAIIDARDKYGRSPLFTATVSSNLAAVDKLLNRGASLSQADNEGRTPLMWAIEYDAPLVVDAFLGRQADRNARDNDGNTIIHIAAKAGRLDMIDKLYLGKSDVEAQNFLGERPLHLAAEADKSAVVKGLLSIGCDPNVFTHPSSTTRNARKAGKKHSFKDFAASPLHYACASGAYDPAAALIMNENNGASVNANQEDGTSPLMLAAEAKSAPIVGLLMQWGANIEAKTSADQLTVLHVAAAAGDLDTVKLLANNGAAIKTVNKKHETPWQYGTKNGTKHNEATQWLSKFSRGQLAPNVHSTVGNLSNTSVFHPAYGYVPSVPSPMYNTYDPNFPPNYNTNYTATGYLPNQRTFYQPPNIQASVRTEEGIEPPPAYTPRRS